MKIAHLTKPWYPIPPVGYGGIERLVFNLVSEQCKYEEIILFATGDSKLNSSIGLCALFQECQGDKGLDRNIELAQAVHCCKKCKELSIDILHVHSVDPFLGVQYNSTIPVIFSFYSNPNVAGKILAELASKDIVYTFLSEYQKKCFNWINNGRVVFPGINLNLYPLILEKGDFLVFVGRICKQKGVLEALEIAKISKLPIKIAGKARIEDLAYFEKVLKTIDEMPQAVFLGEINDHQRNKLVGQARALLFPITEGEPFGLIQIESMAVGTPVIANNIGAASEIVSNEFTGFIINDMDEAFKAVDNAKHIDPKVCRQLVESKFSSIQMAKKYLKLYDSIINS